MTTDDWDDFPVINVKNQEWEKRIKEHREKRENLFGTINNPKFQAQGNIEFKTLREFLEESDVEETNYRLKQLFQTRSIPIEESNETYGNFLRFGEQIFSKMFGKTIPDNLETAILRDVNYHGRHNFEDLSIDLKDRGFASTLVAYFHELGHFVTSHGKHEQHYSGNFCNIKEDELEELSEAIAYVSSMIGSQLVEDTKLKSLMELEIIDSRNIWIGNLFKDKDKFRRDPHEGGWAIADSTLEHFSGNTSQAFNYLSRRYQFNQLAPEIMRMYDFLRTDKKTNEQISKYINSKNQTKK